MEKTIVFSPIGGTDPITNFRDGAMLHILRVYKPDKVVIYLSKEIAEFHEQDNRYCYAIEKLGKHLGHNFEIVVLERRDLTEVQLFDFFYKEFREVLQSIREENPKASLILNVSSGTPAMKGALHTLNALSEFDERAVQVSTPGRKINKIHEDRDEYDVGFLWESNEDNQPNFENRCVLSESLHLASEFKKKMIVRHIQSFDYNAALDIAREISPQDLNPRSLELIEAATYRLNLDIRNYNRIMKDSQEDFLPVKDGEKRPVFEHLLVLRIKILRKEFGDFLRALSPIVSDLFMLSLKYHGQINVKDFIMGRESGQKWDEKKVEMQPELRDALKMLRQDGRGSMVTSYQLSGLVQRLCKNDVVMELCDKIRTVETTVRNIAAHEIISIDESFIEKRTKLQPNQILKYLMQLSSANQVDTSKEAMESYERMNEVIQKLIEQ